MQPEANTAQNTPIVKLNRGTIQVTCDCVSYKLNAGAVRKGEYAAAVRKGECAVWLLLRCGSYIGGFKTD